ncbi:type VI secretion system-associated FHA domain protein TagH [Actibacterium ureilyticum]|uniref:type VI secretion system-associated FHA domain protein TagH n=1 Tax=Actibacterium ureilyticum TaxID=1590614 RepID=UPI000BAB0D5F|nr:type VI secretion system-associated FHA domain protein TagH [Actibacterium ureilyticum]
MAVTLKFQSTGAIPGKGDPFRMNGPSVTIGRGDENDMVLPDPDRVLSKRHCVVEDHNGNVVVVDISTNGTFLNYGKIPLGATPTPLNDGDILCLGPYEIMVSISADFANDPLASLAAPLDDGPVSHGNAGAAPHIGDLLDNPQDGSDFLDDLLGGPDQPTGHKGVERPELGDDGLLPPLGEDDVPPPADDPVPGGSVPSHSPAYRDHFQPRSVAGQPQIPDDWDDDLLSPGGDQTGSAADPFAVPQPPAGGSGGAAFIPEDDAFGEPAAEVPPPMPQTTVPPKAPPATAAPPSDAARAFLDALGADADLNIADDELPDVMGRLGRVTRAVIEGLREILMTRASIKSEFRIEQTQIAAGGNNPLKFSISPEQAIQAMVKPTTKGYLDAEEAAAQALSDIKAHEVAMLTGMDAALKGVLARLDPAMLESKIQSKGGFANMLKSKKARYWEIYEEMYSEISEQAEEDFHELFSKEFARAYRAQLDRLKK